MQQLYPSLPNLDDEELDHLFDADQEGIRRYRLLQDLLLNRVSQLEAATRHGVSERTVRNVLRTYRDGSGVEALRSRRTTRRVVSWRRKTFEPVIAQALDEDPLAGGDRIWRRAQMLLGDGGVALSRRTAYRILARLRAAPRRADPEDGLFAAVRTALPLLTEDPPLALGATSLAQRLLPDEPDQAARGTLLQQALRAALDRLRPAGSTAPIDRNWWPYLICSREYEGDVPRAKLQRELALSASTYSRAKRQGLTQLANSLPRIIATLRETPLAGQRLPRIPDFVGRRVAQNYYARQLHNERSAWLWGLPGSGKTALAAELAADERRYGRTILWHTCRPGFDATQDGILSGLAQSLPSRDDSGTKASESADRHALLEWLQFLLRARPTLIVIDDAHLMSNADVEALCTAVFALDRRNLSRLLFVGRACPLPTPPLPLEGLDEHEARMLWEGLPALPEEQWRALYAASGGLPLLLRFAAATYRRAEAGSSFDDGIVEMVAWAEEAIWTQLTEPEQRLLVMTHAFAGRPWAAHAGLLLGAIEIAPALLEQAERHGLVCRDGLHLQLHPVLQQGAHNRLRDDYRLRALLSALAATIAETAGAALDTPAAVAASTPEPAPAAANDLLHRLRDALVHSAAYLERKNDQTAQQLVSELAVLQAALSDTLGRIEPRRSHALATVKG